MGPTRVQEGQQAEGGDSSVLSPTRWRVRFGRILVLLDVVVIALSIALAFVVRRELGDVEWIRPLTVEIPVALAVLPLWLLILYGFGCYRPEYQSQGREAFRRFLVSNAVALLVLGFVSFLFRLELSRLWVAFLVVFVVLLGSTARWGVRAYLRRARQHGRLLHNVLIVGCDEEAQEIVEAMRSDTAVGYEVVGFVDDALPVGERITGDLGVVGPTSEILELARQHRAGMVLVSPTGVSPGTLRDTTIALEGSPIDLAIAPSLFEVVTRRVTVEAVSNVALLHVEQVRLTGFREAAKTMLDIVVAGSLVLLLWPVMCAAAVAIKLGDRGRVLFRQTRVGRDGEEFTLLKFRTMVPDAESLLDEVAELNEVGHRFFKIREDPRVTRVGRLLRKWSIDETPQLWNVLRGEMSLVGPRPPLPSEVEQYEPWHMRRLRTKPGITGVWQVSGRSNIPFDEAVRMDLFYIENWSLAEDIVLLLKTIPAVLGRRGAH